MLITLVAAASENNVIGKNNQLLWSLPNDFKFFKNTTWAMPVIMGSKTFASLNNTPLPGRFNIVVTRRPEALVSNGPARAASSLKEAVDVARETDAKEVFVIGGGQIYQEALPMAQKMVLTRVHTNIDGDAFFPAFTEKEWKLFSRLDFPADDKHAYPYSFEVWLRK